MATLYQERLVDSLKQQISLITDNLSPDFPPDEDVIEQNKNTT